MLNTSPRTLAKLALFACSLFSYFASAQNLPSIAELRDYHNKRVEKFRSFELKWEGTVTRPNEDWPGPIPTSVLKLRDDGTIRVQGSSSRVDAYRDVWNYSEQSVVEDAHFIEIYSNGVAKGYYAFIKHGVVNRLHPVRSFFPQAMATNSLLPDPSYLTGDRMKVLRQEDTPDGPVLVVGNDDYRHDEDEFIGRMEYFLSIDKDYVLIRKLGMSPEGRIYDETTIAYEDDPLLGPLPKSVKITRAGSSNETPLVQNFQLMDIVSIEFDKTFSAEVFEIEFPQGTFVYDEIAGVEYTVGDQASSSSSSSSEDRVSNGIQPTKTDGASRDIVSIVYVAGAVMVVLLGLGGVGWTMRRRSKSHVPAESEKRDDAR